MQYCMEVTVTDRTKGPWQVLKLLRGGSGANGYTGVTIEPSEIANGYREIAVEGVQCYLSIQSDPTNSGILVFEGNSLMDVDGEGAGLSMANGQVDVHQATSPRIPLADYFIATDTNGAVIRIRAYTT